jgi:hypothetical protein
MVCFFKRWRSWQMFWWSKGPVLHPGHLLQRARREQGRTCLRHAAGKKHTYFPFPPLEWNDLAWHRLECKKHYLSLLYDWILVLQLLLLGLNRRLCMMARLMHVKSTPSSIIIYMWPVQTILGLTINRCLPCSKCIAIYSKYILKFKCSYSMVILRLSCSNANALFWN